jgi:hypothetical protein
VKGAAGGGGDDVQEPDGDLAAVEDDKAGPDKELAAKDDYDVVGARGKEARLAGSCLDLGPGCKEEADVYFDCNKDAKDEFCDGDSAMGAQDIKEKVFGGQDSGGGVGQETLTCPKDGESVSHIPDGQDFNQEVCVGQDSGGGVGAGRIVDRGKDGSTWLDAQETLACLDNGESCSQRLDGQYKEESTKDDEDAAVYKEPAVGSVLGAEVVKGSAGRGGDGVKEPDGVGTAVKDEGGGNVKVDTEASLEVIKILVEDAVRPEGESVKPVNYLEKVAPEAVVGKKLVKPTVKIKRVEAKAKSKAEVCLENLSVKEDVGEDSGGEEFAALSARKEEDDLKLPKKELLIKMGAVDVLSAVVIQTSHSKKELKDFEDWIRTKWKVEIAMASLNEDVKGVLARVVTAGRVSSEVVREEPRVKSIQETRLAMKNKTKTYAELLMLLHEVINLSTTGQWD